jgi:TolA-binding protein
LLGAEAGAVLLSCPTAMNRTIPAVASALMFACIYPAERGKLLEQEVRELKQDLNEQGSRLDAQIPKLDGKVLEVSTALDKLDKASRRTGADIGVQMEQVQGDLARLRGQMEEYLHRIGELEGSLATIKDQQDKSMLARGEEPAKKRSEPVERPTDKKGFAELTMKKLDEEPAVGRELATEFLKKWPKDSLAARVHLGLGNSWFDKKEWRVALSEYGEIVKGFGKAPEAPEALLKSSECFAALKMAEESRLALEEILNTYPKAEAAGAAKAKLAEIKKAPKPKSTGSKKAP